MKMKMNWERLLTQKRADEPKEGEYNFHPSENFEEDYRSIVGSASFRRLQDKTQVFPLDRSDFVRTRLTHSLEVSSEAAALAASVTDALFFRGLAPEISEGMANDISQILRAAGLIHDIGNPPFGHYGETTIREWFREKLPELKFFGSPLTEVLGKAEQKDLCHYDGNAQALRILSKLHVSSSAAGMNLSLSLLGSMMKYPYSSEDIVGSCDATETPADNAGFRSESQEKEYPLRKTIKTGYFQSEKKIFTEISESCGTFGKVHPLALILEAADDISYRTADIEDAFRKGRFSLEELMWVLSENPRLRAYEKTNTVIFREALRQIEMLSAFYDGAKAEKRHKADEFALQKWLSFIRRLMRKDAAECFADLYNEIMSGVSGVKLTDGRISGLLLDILGDIAYDYVFSSKEIIRMEIAAGSIIGGLLDKFVPAAIYWDTGGDRSSVEKRLLSIISDNYRAAYFRESGCVSEPVKLYLRLMLVCDYISGMTDHFAKRLYQDLEGMR